MGFNMVGCRPSKGDNMPESVNQFEMRRLEALSNTIFGVAMTLLAYNLPKGQILDGPPSWSTISAMYQLQVLALLISFVVRRHVLDFSPAQACLPDTCDPPGALSQFLVSLVDCRAAGHLRPFGFVWRHARCGSALFLPPDRDRWIERHPLASCWTGARPTECGDRNGVHDRDLYFGDLLCVDRPANLHREIHLVLRLCNANDRGIPRKAQTEPHNMTPEAVASARIGQGP
jgi:hypothetical protein